MEFENHWHIKNEIPNTNTIKFLHTQISFHLCCYFSWTLNGLSHQVEQYPAGVDLNRDEFNGKLKLQFMRVQFNQTICHTCPTTIPMFEL